MAVVYILLGLVGLILLILLTPLYARVSYDGELRVKLWVWGIPVTLLPSGESPSDKIPKKRSRKEEKSSKKEELAAQFRQDGVEATLRFLGEAARIAMGAVGRLLRCITVDKLLLEMRIAADDAADTAVRYGQVCGVLYPTLSALSGPVRVKKQSLRVEPNFLVEKSDVRLDVRLHVAVYRLAAAALWLLWRLIMLKTLDDSKEGVQHGK